MMISRRSFLKVLASVPVVGILFRGAQPVEGGKLYLASHAEWVVENGVRYWKRRQYRVPPETVRPRRPSK